MTQFLALITPLSPPGGGWDTFPKPLPEPTPPPVDPGYGIDIGTGPVYPSHPIAGVPPVYPSHPIANPPVYPAHPIALPPSVPVTPEHPWVPPSGPVDPGYFPPGVVAPPDASDGGGNWVWAWLPGVGWRWVRVPGQGEAGPKK